MENLVAGNVKTAMKEVGAVSADLWQVEPGKLRVIEGFNVRVKDQKYTERVEWIANSIAENGFYKDKPLAGYVAREGEENVIYVTGGHRRHEAVLLAISRGAPIEVVPVVVTKGQNVEDLTVALITGNDGEPLSAYESALACARLARFGWTSAQIAKRVGYASSQYVDGLLTLAAAPLAVREKVVAGEVSATAAIASLTKYGAKAPEVLKAASVAAKGAKVTPKHLPQNAFRSTLKKNAEPMYLALTKVTQDSAYMDLATETRELLVDLLGKIGK